jgi:hypothetical protein
MEEEEQPEAEAPPEEITCHGGLTLPRPGTGSA